MSSAGQYLYFSPLFIGEPRSTTLTIPELNYSNKHFSPLLIGDPFSTTHHGNDGALILNFSPLFIGEPRSTTGGSTGGLGGTTFQSPLHRGATFNSPRPSTPALHLPISVPS